MNRQILRLAIPNIITNISIPLLGIVDLHLMGHLSSEVYIGAVALGTVIFNFVYWGFAFLRMSMSGMVAQSYGAVDGTESAALLSRGLFIAILGSLLLLIAQWPLIHGALWLMNGSEDVKSLASVYFYIRVWSAPATIGQMVFFGWFLGMQNASILMTISIIVNIVNIACSFVFVKVFGMALEGVAVA